MWVWFFLLLLYHNLITTCTNTTKCLLLMQNFMGFLLQFTETGYYNHNWRYLVKYNLVWLVDYHRPSQIMQQHCGNPKCVLYVQSIIVTTITQPSLGFEWICTYKFPLQALYGPRSCVCMSVMSLEAVLQSIHEIMYTGGRMHLYTHLLPAIRCHRPIGETHVQFVLSTTAYIQWYIDKHNMIIL